MKLMEELIESNRCKMDIEIAILIKKNCKNFVLKLQFMQ